MALFGNISSYDSGKGVGVISPEKGGDDLAFKKGDLQQQALEPQPDQRFRYETVQLDGGRMRAVNLRQVHQGQVTQGKMDQGSDQQAHAGQGEEASAPSDPAQMQRDQARQQKG